MRYVSFENGLKVERRRAVRRFKDQPTLSSNEKNDSAVDEPTGFGFKPSFMPHIFEPLNFAFPVFSIPPHLCAVVVLLSLVLRFVGYLGFKD